MHRIKAFEEKQTQQIENLLISATSSSLRENFNNFQIQFTESSDLKTINTCHLYFFNKLCIFD